ncbi:hypothetical protein GDO86_002328 [Hymenochirus boettgeri]|uniref:Proteinase-activated receptor 3 n=1 Tax=Hymenochirus boettgeri TaxID=247094 RepID=A0A8T2KGG4_9PIPI|nr:hypothetical protein GDO86_002328 [Hymenochirus boettgeri]
MKVLLALLLLYGVSLGLEHKLKANDIIPDKNESTGLPKTFRGRSGDYEKVPEDSSHVSPETSLPTNNKPSNLGSKKTHMEVNNATTVFLSSKISTVLIPGIYGIIVLVGVPSNAIVLWMLFYRVRSVCSTVLYTSLATSDLLFCLILPFKIAYHINGNNWIFGETMCQVATIFLYGNMYCSIFLLMCISINRYLAIVHPFLYRVLPKRTYAILMCALMWIIVVVYMIPFFITKQTYYLKELNIITCHDVYDISEDVFQFYYFMSLSIFGFLIPFFVVAFCYFSIIRSLATNEHKRFCYVKITILLFIIFALCFTPSNVILLVHQVRYHYSYRDDLYAMYLIALCLSSLNSCLDPFLYFLLSKKMNALPNFKTRNEAQAKLIYN